MILNFVIGILLAFILSGIAYYKQWLDRSGTIAATVIGGIVWGIGGWHTSVPLIIFFATSSLLSLSKRKVAVVDEKENQPRDAMQVICNGGVAAVCLIVYAFSNDWIFMLAYWASVAVSMADTWSSAIGTSYASKVFDITTGRQMVKGLSGGVSGTGTLGGFAGSLMIAAIGWVTYHFYFPLLLITIAGFAGMLLDSVLGSIMQVKYVQQDGKQLESVRLVRGAFTQKGIGWMNNDAVNILSNMAVVVLLLIYLKCM